MSGARSLMHSGAVALSLLLLGACGGSDSDPGVSGGGEIAVNSYSAGDQQRPAVASNGQGRSVVVWESYGQDGSHFGIFGQRFVDGRPEGSEFRANTYTTGRQNLPAVAMDAAGNFVVAWRSSLQGSPGGTIFAQLFAADGSRLGGEFRVGPDDSDRDSQSEPQIAMNALGDFVVAWSNRAFGVIPELLGQNNIEDRWIEARSYAASGEPRTNPVRITRRNTDQYPRAPKVALDENGRLLIVWATAAGGTVIRAQHFDLGLSETSPPYDVNTPSAEIGVDQATVAMAPDGRFAVAWEGFTYGYVPVGILVQRYSGPQQRAGDARVIAPPSSGLVERSGIALTPDGALLVAAQAQDRVHFASVDAEGRLRGPSQISSGAGAMFAALAPSGEGKAFVAWQSRGQDGDGRGIRARELSIR